MRRIALAVLAAGLWGCGGSDGSPSGPSSNTASIAVTLSNVLKAGQTEQASATATLSGGGSQTITTGFRSDTPSVATVTDAGLVSAVGNGLANIYVVSGGRQGTRNLKVVPDLEGTWRGTHVVTACSGTGFFLDPVMFCGGTGFSVGQSGQVSASISQVLDSTTQSFALGGLNFNSATGMIAPDGSTSITTTVISDSPTIGIQLTIRLSSSSAGVAAGTLSETWTALGLPGTGQLESSFANFVRVTRTVSALPAGRRVLPRSVADAMRLMQ